ncbi:MAG: response regulator [Candidatus Methanoperedens sp.]|nr:response regulator [Candidatus Methanoperedens sp.]
MIESKKVLVVEDESIVALEIQDRLIGFGYSSMIASSGEEAIKKAIEFQPDIILMDIMLRGGMDGIEAAGRIKRSLDIPIVYLTAYSDEATIERAKITQPFGYLIKPFQPRELNVSLDIALYKHNMERRLKDSERWLNATLNSIGDAVITTDRNGITKIINPYAEALTGWKHENAVGRPLGEIFNVICAKTGEKAQDPLNILLREGNFFGLAEDTVLISRNGNKIPVEIIGNKIQNDKNEFLGAVIAFYDINERKKIEEMIASGIKKAH